MKPGELRNMTEAEIEQKLLGFKEELFEMKKENASERVERHSKIRLLKRDIARCYTLLKEKNRGE